MSRVQIDDISKFDYDIEIYRNGDYTDLKIIDNTSDETIVVDISIDRITIKRLISSLIDTL